ncbi:MAG: HEAT repeat domain-containing protein [Candidatus Deferrimicrobiaceae bacterium]
MMGKIGVSTRIRKNLASPDAGKRRSAVEALSRGDERAIYPLIQALRDSHPGVQDSAMRSLIAVGGEVAAWMVLPLLRETPFLRNAAMVILKEIGADAVSHLPPLLKDRDDDVRKFAIELIADAGGRHLEKELCERLSDDQNPNVRGAAAKALGALRCADALPNLVAALKDIEWVRFTTLEALSGMRDAAAVEPILALLSDPSPLTRFTAIEALGEIGSSRAGEALLAHLGSADKNERAAILKSLLRIGVPLPGAGFPEDLLEIFLGDDEWKDRLVALRGLAGIADENALRAIFDVAGSLDATNLEDEEILLAIKVLLLRCGSLGALRGLLDDPTLRFRGKTILAEVVGELQLREAVPNLVVRLLDDVRDVRIAAAQALGRIGDAGAREALLAAIQDPEGHVRKAVVAALGAVGGKEAFEPLLSLLLREEYDDVAREAVRALFAIDPEMLDVSSGRLDGRARDLVDAFARERIGGGGAEDAAKEVWK